MGRFDRESKKLNNGEKESEEIGRETFLGLVVLGEGKEGEVEMRKKAEALLDGAVVCFCAFGGNGHEMNGVKNMEVLERGWGEGNGTKERRFERDERVEGVL